ncbi:MAG: hypothetical protein L0Z50_28095 [Verrucomicrobiales bacterium]|nr:hypothetical protein [Verrucomicrobiales bacterium]
MTKRTLIIAGLFAIGMMVWVAFQREPREPQASVTFLGYTNDATGTRLATFVHSNLNSFVVRRRAHYWIELPTSAGGTNQASCWFSSGNDLKARAFEIVAVPGPTNQPSWRVSLSVTPDVGIVTEAMDFVGFIFFGFQSPFPQRRSYEVRSDWIEADK